MNRADLPEECRDMPRGLVIPHLGIDPSERPSGWPTHADLDAAIAELAATVNRERS